MHQRELWYERKHTKSPFLFEKGVKKKMCLTKVYDNPHQTTIILSTPCVWHEHPETCLTDVLPEVVILVNQSNQGCYLLNSFVLVYVLVLFLVSHRYKKSAPLSPAYSKPSRRQTGSNTIYKERVRLPRGVSQFPRGRVSN